MSRSTGTTRQHAGFGGLDPPEPWPPSGAVPRPETLELPIETLTDMTLKVRPSARVELVETLGAVVGTHAGPGAVGFFWFQD